METALGVCAGALLFYNALALTCKRASGLALMLQSGRSWTRKHIVGRGVAEVTLAIQTLRNTVLVATFVGTLSFTVAAAALAAVSGADGAPARARALLQASLLTGAFLNFALVIRCAAHAGYVIGSVAAQQEGGDGGAAAWATAAAAEEGGAAPARAAEELALREASSLLRMQAVHFSLGFRFMYCSIPFAFAVAGWEALVISTISVLSFLFYIDNAVSFWGGAAERRRDATALA